MFFETCRTLSSFSAYWTFHVYSLWVDSGCPTFFWTVVFSFWHLLIFRWFSKHDASYHRFQLIGHFMSTHLWVDSECPNFFLACRFFILTLVNISMFFRTCCTLSSFSAHWAFRVYSSLSGFGMPYFFLAHLIFSFWHLLIFWCFSKHDACYHRFQLIGHFVSNIFEWIWNALLFFGSSFYNAYFHLISERI